MAATVHAQKFRMFDVGKLRPHPANPREGDVGAIGELIEANGFYGAVLVQKSRQRILVGEHRWRAARQRGVMKIPGLEIDVDDKLARDILLGDNAASDKASNDIAKLTEQLQSKLDEGGSLDGTGYDGDDLDELLKDLEAEHDAFEVATPARSEYGVFIECETEQEQTALIDRLVDEGLSCHPA